MVLDLAIAGDLVQRCRTCPVRGPSDLCLLLRPYDDSSFLAPQGLPTEVESPALQRHRAPLSDSNGVACWTPSLHAQQNRRRGILQCRCQLLGSLAGVPQRTGFGHTGPAFLVADALERPRFQQPAYTAETSSCPSETVVFLASCLRCRPVFLQKI